MDNENKVLASEIIERVGSKDSTFNNENKGLASEVIADIQEEQVHFLNMLYDDILDVVYDLEKLQLIATDILSISGKTASGEQHAFLFENEQQVIYAKSAIVGDYGFKIRKAVNEILKRIEARTESIREEDEDE